MRRQRARCSGVLLARKAGWESACRAERARPSGQRAASGSACSAGGDEHARAHPPSFFPHNFSPGPGVISPAAGGRARQLIMFGPRFNSAKWCVPMPTDTPSAPPGAPA
jgi:hypothetical protein